MNDCCGDELRSQSFHSMLKSIVDSKIINIEVLTVAVGILFAIVLLKNKYRSFSGT